MRHRRLRGKLGVKTKHRTALLRNLVRNLVIHKQIRTTLNKAKAASRLADQMIHLAKDGNLHAHRLLIARLGSSETAQRILELAPHFKERNGGYTRVLRLGYRAGDAAETALLEFTVPIERPEKPKKPKKEKKAKETKVSEEPEKKKKEKEKVKEKEAEAKQPEKKEEGKKEAEKKGGFLSALRKFLKGDDKSQ